MECFIVYSQNIKDRIDPHFFRPEFIKFYKRLEKTKFKIKTIGEIAEKVTSGATPLSKGDAYTSKDEGIPFIRSGDINEDKKIDFDEVLYIKDEIHNKLLKGSKLKKGDVLIAIVGATIGQVSVYDYDKESNINQAIALVRLKQEINPEYVKAFMISTLGQKQLNRIKRPVARANINLDEIRNIRIILPPLAIQNEIIALMENAYKEQKNKEKKIDDFLNSINDFVLDELGIRLLESEDKKCFVVLSDEVKSRRIDPKAYLDKPKTILKTIKKSKYKLKKLSEIVFENISGKWGKDPLTVKETKDYVLCNVLRNTNFNNQFNLNFEDVAQRLIPRNKIEKVKLKKGDILIEKSGGSPVQPVGRVALIEDISESYTFSNFLQCFRINEKECLPDYLFTYLKAIYSLNYMEYVQNQTTGIKNLIMEEYLAIPVILPSLEIQNKIAKEVKNRQRKAKQLQEESKHILDQAKQEVEKMILNQ